MREHKRRRIGILLICMILFAGLFAAQAYAAGETAEFNVKGYESGGDWDIALPKPLTVNAEKLTLDQGGYYIEIKLKKGMRLDSFLWNTDPEDAADWTIGNGVKGTPVHMKDSALTDGSVKIDEDGNTVLTYHTSNGCSAIRLTDKITVVPNELLAYDGDEIEGAIQFRLLDGEKNELNTDTSSVNVKVTGDKISNSSYTMKKVVKGTKDVHLYEVFYYRKWDGQSSAPLPAGTADITLGIPECVENVTKVVPYDGTSPIDSDKLIFNEANHTLNITDYPVAEGDRFRYSIYGDIKETAAPKEYYADPEATVFDFHTYDGGDRKYVYPVDFVNCSRYGVEVADRQNTLEVRDDKTEFVYAQLPEGHPTILGKLRNIYTANEQTSDQIVTWTFGEDTVDVTGVFFPVDKATGIRVTSITFDNGETVTNASGWEFVKTGSSKMVYVNAEELKAKVNLPETEGARYIRSIQANCGKFSAGYSNESWYGKPVGRFSQTVENAGVRQKVEYQLRIASAGSDGDPYTNKFSVIYDPAGEFACLNITNTVYKNAGRTETTTSCKAGNPVYVKSRISTGGNLLTPTSEPCLFVVVPKGMTFDPAKMKVHDWVTVSNSAAYYPTGAMPKDLTAKLEYDSGYVRDSAGEYYLCYEFYVRDSVVGPYREFPVHDARGFYSTSLDFEYEFEIDETTPTQPLDLGEYVMAGKGSLETERFIPIKGNNNVSSHADSWDLNGNGERNETGVISASACGITILDNMNITVSGYLTHPGETGAVHPYDPGNDGSNEVNVVEFLPDTYADYHVVVANTLVGTTERCAVKAYIPIPGGTFDGQSRFTPSNTMPAGSADANGIYQYYQFKDYQWPMSLRGPVENVDPKVFDIIYYLGGVTIGVNGAAEKSSDGTDIMNPDGLTGEQLAKVALVEIRSKENVSIPNSTFNFTLPLKVGVSETQATEAGLNLSKNIFRPRYYREGGIGDVWVNGNYVAARLAVSSIGGFVFEDRNGNGLWEKEGEDSEPAIPGMSVELYKDKTKLGDTLSGENGKYTFTTTSLGRQLEKGTYELKFINSDGITEGLFFTKHHPATKSNYQKNSEAQAADDHSYATASLTLPYSGVMAGYQEYQNAGLFIDKTGGGDNGAASDGIPDACQVRVDYKAEKGAVTGKTFEYFSEENGGGWSRTFDLTIANPPAVKADTGCVLKHWENDHNTEKTQDGRFTFENIAGGSEVTVTAVFEEKNYEVTFDANAGDDTTVSGMPAKAAKQHGVDLTLSDGIPTRDGHIFTAWNTKADGEGSEYKPGARYKQDADATLYAQWTENSLGFHVAHHFETVGSSGVYDDPETEYLTGKIGTEGAAAETVVPAKEVPGFTFDKAGALIPEGNGIAVKEGTAGGPVTLLLKLGDEGGFTVPYYYTRKTTTITYQDGNKVLKSFSGRYGAEVTEEPPVPDEKENMVFAGWDKETPESFPSEDMILNARWKEKHTVTFNYLNSDGTAADYTVTGPAGTSVTAPEVPARAGYEFQHWEGQNGWDEGVPEVIPDTDVTFQAKYHLLVYTIGYELNGGTVNGMNPKTYTVESGEITLINPTRGKDTFLGWTGTDLTEPSTEVKIAAGSTGDRIYTAAWPGTVPYTVEHYQQELDGSYPGEPTETETLHGIPGNETKAVAKEYDGFTPGSFEQQEITGASRITIKIYYSRNTYTVRWLDHKGTELQSNQALFGAEIPSYEGKTPQKPATAYYTYTFQRWQPNAAWAEGGIVKGDLTYTPVFKETPVSPGGSGGNEPSGDPDDPSGPVDPSAQYEIVFDPAGGLWDDETTKPRTRKVKYGTKIKIPEGPLKDGYTFLWWEEADADEAAGEEKQAYYPGDPLVVKRSQKFVAVWSDDSDGKNGILILKMTSKKKNQMKFAWTKVKGADGYDIFLSRCNAKGKKYKIKKVRTVKGNRTFRWTKKKLKKKNAYKAVVKAYVMKDGRKQYIKTSPMAHAYTSAGTKKYTNSKAVKLKKTRAVIKKGKTLKIKAGVVKQKKKKKLMNHAPKFRYISSNKKIASVTAKCRIRAKAPGTCKIYVYSVSGVYKTMKIIVK